AHTDFSGIGPDSKHITGFFGALKSAYSTDMDYPAQSANRATPLRLLEYVQIGPEDRYERYADIHQHDHADRRGGARQHCGRHLVRRACRLAFPDCPVNFDDDRSHAWADRGLFDLRLAREVGSQTLCARHTLSLR